MQYFSCKTVRLAPAKRESSITIFTHTHTHTCAHPRTHTHKKQIPSCVLSAQRNHTLLHYKHHRLDTLEVLHEGVQYKWKRRHHASPSSPAGIKSVGNLSYNYAVVHTILAHAGIVARPHTRNCDTDIEGQSTAEHYIASKEYKHAQKKAFHIP